VGASEKEAPIRRSLCSMDAYVSDGGKGLLAVVAGGKGRAANVAIRAQAAVIARSRLYASLCDSAGEAYGRRFRRMHQLAELIPVERLYGRAVIERKQRRELAEIDVLGAQEAATTALSHRIVATDCSDFVEDSFQSQEVKRHLQAEAAIDIAEVGRLAELVVQRQRAPSCAVEIDTVDRTTDGDRWAAILGLEQ